MQLFRGAALALVLVVATAAPGWAHKPSRVTAREFVRLAGAFVTPGEGAEAPAEARSVALAVQGRERTFGASAWQVFALVSDEGAADAPPLPARLTLQGARELTARIAAARPDQRVSILAERRPGSGELFVLAVDLCPAD